MLGCVDVRVSVCRCVGMHVCCVYKSVCCIRIRVYIYVYVLYMFGCMHEYVYVYVQVCMSIYIYYVYLVACCSVLDSFVRSELSKGDSELCPL